MRLLRRKIVMAMAMALTVAILMVMTSTSGYALPRFTLLSGSRCSNCHFNPQGSGLRNELGWMAMSETGALTLEEVGLGGLQSESNTFLNSHLTVGLDARLQSVRIGRPPDTRRLTFPMQLTPYAGLSFGEELKIYGGFNVATMKHRYQGQTVWNGAVQYQPSLLAPSIRAGLIQPSVGIRHDDHTMAVRQEAANSRSPVIPPDFNEYGAELTYEGKSWLTINAGIYDSHSLQEIEPTIDSGSLSYSGRIAFWPQILDAELNTLFGGSILANGDYTMMNLFAGLGVSGRTMIYGEAMLSDNVNDRRLRNFTAIVQTQLWEWLALEMRYDWGQTEVPPSNLYYSSAFTLGAQFFPIPFLEVRPEYRFYQNDDYRQGEYTIQVHAFY